MADAGSVVCVGLDPDLDRLPDRYRTSTVSSATAVETFCKDVIRATAPFCSSYKPNLAFFEALGPQGLQVFGEVCDAVPQNRLIIADAKRGDIGNTARQYAKAFLEVFGCDAVTVNPLMGAETLHAYLGDASKAVYVLTLTSNPGAADFLEAALGGYPSQAEAVAAMSARLDAELPGHVGMVVGATRPEAMAPLLERHPQGSLLLPGLGAQGGDVESLIAALADHQGLPVVPVSRGILFGAADEQNADPVARRAESYRETLLPLTRRYV